MSWDLGSTTETSTSGRCTLLSPSTHSSPTLHVVGNQPLPSSLDELLGSFQSTHWAFGHSTLMPLAIMAEMAASRFLALSHTSSGALDVVARSSASQTQAQATQAMGDLALGQRTEGGLGPQITWNHPLGVSIVHPLRGMDCHV